MKLVPPMNGQFFSEPVQHKFEFDNGPGKYRIGLIVLSNDLATEHDFVNMAGNNDISILVSRIQNAEICSVENLKAMEPELTNSASLLIPGYRLDAIAYSCTSGTVVLGYDAIARRIHAVRPGIPVATPITAATSALNQTRSRKIAVLTPYTDDVNRPIANYLAEHGFEVVAFSSFKLANNEAMAKVPPKAIYNAALEVDCPQAEAIFISCTAIRAVDVVDSIEKRVGKPVVTANQALFWQSVRSAGYTSAITGYGNLLRQIPQIASKPTITVAGEAI